MQSFSSVVIRFYLCVICLLFTQQISAQVGEHRNDLSVGVNGGYVFSNVGFVPTVPQGLHGGMTGGFSLRYVCEKYFLTYAWGRERKGCQFFFQAGPQFGFLLGESTKMNFNLAERNIEDRINKTYAQDSMSIKNKFDYGIAAGLGLEYSIPRVGHFLLEGRYYYGLGNIFGDSKRDYFSKSNYGNIYVKLTYLMDIFH